MHPRDPLGVIADALAHDASVTITGSTERDVAKRLIRALCAVYGTELRTTAPHPMAAGIVYGIVPMPTAYLAADQEPTP